MKNMCEHSRIRVLLNDDVRSFKAVFWVPLKCSLDIKTSFILYFFFSFLRLLSTISVLKSFVVCSILKYTSQMEE